MKKEEKARIYFISMTLIAAIVTLTVFTLMFITADGGIYGEIVSEPPIADKPPSLNIPETNAFTSKKELEDNIKKFEEYLNSPYLEIVDKNNKVSSIPHELTALKTDERFQLKKEAAAQLEAFLKQAKKDGFAPKIYRGFVSEEEQQEIYDKEYAKNVAAGYTEQNLANEKTLLSEGLPGHSEHQTGFAIDLAQTPLTDVNAAKNSVFYEYALKHICDYGFILSYPEGKTAVTGHDFEPWHFRYIGDAEQARFIMEKGMCLVEYRDYLNKRIRTLKIKLDEIERNKFAFEDKK